MSYTDNVAEFMDSVGELDGVDVDDLEAVAPEAIKKVRSQPNSPFGNETHSNWAMCRFHFDGKCYLFHHGQRHEKRAPSELDYGTASKMVLPPQTDTPMETGRIYKMAIPMRPNIPTMNTSIRWRCPSCSHMYSIFSIRIAKLIGNRLPIFRMTHIWSRSQIYAIRVHGPDDSEPNRPTHHPQRPST